MARYKHYDYHQLMMVPVSLAEQLMPMTLEYAIHHVVEECLDLSIFDHRYCNDETGRKAIDPKILIKIVLFGYLRGLISSRSLERAMRCSQDNKNQEGDLFVKACIAYFMYLFRLFKSARYQFFKRIILLS